MKTTIHQNRLLWALCAILALVVVSTFAVRSAGGGINGGGIYFGSIDEFGSIFVNGVEFELAGAAITIDDAPGIESDLRLGQVVTVAGVVNLDGVTGNAISVNASSDLRGIVTAVDTATSRFTVLGQVVRVDGATLYGPLLSPASIAGVGVGRTVVVSGHRDATEVLVATRIDRATSSLSRVVGTISRAESGVYRFNIGALTVDYSSASRLEGSIVDGARVQVEGTALSPTLLAASKVEAVQFKIGSAGSGASIEGFVTASLAQGRFAVGGQPVSLTTSTVFVDGTAADLVANTKVEAEGRVDGSGVVVAQTVRIVWPDLARVHGIVTRTPASGGWLEVNGLVVTTASGTRFEDRSDQRQSRFGLADIRVGDTIEARGVEPRELRTIRAGLVQRVRPDNRTWIEAVVSAARPGQLVMLDTPVSATPTTAYEDASGRRLDAATFFAQAVHREVKARGTWTGASLIADQLAFKN